MLRITAIDLSKTNCGIWSSLPKQNYTTEVQTYTLTTRAQNATKNQKRQYTHSSVGPKYIAQKIRYNKYFMKK
jgi:hypothetical protein